MSDPTAAEQTPQAERVSLDRDTTLPIAQVIIAIEDERLRQITREGRTLAHDDTHDFGELARAAASHALNAAAAVLPPDNAGLRETLQRRAGIVAPPGITVKRHDARRHLLIAAALIVAEIERLDRYAAHAAGLAGDLFGEGGV